MKQMCATCPFRLGSEYANLAPSLTVSALSEGSRICHCTGSNGLKGRTGKPERLCRGARDMQLRVLASTGFLEAATDEAWDKKRKELNV